MVAKTRENIITALKYYVPIRFWNLNNWDIIVEREEEVEENIFKYRCSFYELYFNEELEPIEYKHQHIIDGKVYYEEESDYEPLAYLFLGFADWYKRYDWGI